MFFTRLGRIVAVVALALGVLKVVGGVAMGMGLIGRSKGAVLKYYGKSVSSAEIIDTGIYIILFAIALGILTEIRTALAR